MIEVRLQTYWADCDPAGIVFFANFFRFVEQAEEEVFLRASASRQQMLDAHSVWIPRVETHVNFLGPIKNGHAVRVRLDPQFKGEKTVRLEFKVLDDETGKELANGYVTAVCVDRATFKSRPIPEEIREVLRGS